MKKLLSITVACIITCGFLSGIKATDANAAEVNKWYITQDTDITVTLFSTPELSVGIYDWGADPSTGIDIVSGSGLIVGSVDVTKVGDDFFIEDLNIGTTPEIGLYIFGGSTYYSYTATLVGDGFSLTADIGGLTLLTVEDVSLLPAPVPAAFIIFGSGLIGLLGFRRITKA